MPLATKPVRVITCNKELPSIKSHDLPLITWSSNFDFSYMIYRFKAQAHKLPPSSCTPPSSPQFLGSIRDFGAKKYFTGHRIVNTIKSQAKTIQLFVARKREVKWNSPETT